MHVLGLCGVSRKVSIRSESGLQLMEAAAMLKGKL